MIPVVPFGSHSWVCEWEEMIQVHQATPIPCMSFQLFLSPVIARMKSFLEGVVLSYLQLSLAVLSLGSGSMDR